MMLLQSVLVVMFVNIMMVRQTPATGTHCSDALGMESGKIKDSQITASRVYGSAYPELARLNRNISSWGAWCADQKNGKQMHYDEYIKIDLLNVLRVTKVATQGREYKSGIEYTTKYKISYSDDSSNWIYYKDKDSPPNKTKVFDGNTDVSTVVSHTLDPVIVARYIRIHPGIFKSAICLRLELYGCKVTPDILSYSMPQGQTTKNKNIHYFDNSYSGTNRNGILVGGTGLLTDGKIGPVNSKLHKGGAWVGWSPQFTDTPVVNITFEFSSLRKFDSVTFTVNVNSARYNTLFHKSRIFFGATKDELSGSSFLQYCPQQNQPTNGVKNVNLTLSLCDNIGKFVRIQLYLGGKWLLLSEIQFSSVPTTESPPTTLETCSKGVLCGRVDKSSSTSSPSTPVVPTCENDCPSTTFLNTDTDDNCFSESQSSNLLPILIGLASLFCLIALIILALLIKWKLFNSKQPTPNVSLEMESIRPINVPTTATTSATQASNNDFEEVPPDEGGYEYPFAGRDVIPDPSYTELSERTDDGHFYQKLIKPEVI